MRRGTEDQETLKDTRFFFGKGLGKTFSHDLGLRFVGTVSIAQAGNYTVAESRLGMSIDFGSSLRLCVRPRGGWKHQRFQERPGRVCCCSDVFSYFVPSFDRTWTHDPASPSFASSIVCDPS